MGQGREAAQASDSCTELTELRNRGLHTASKRTFPVLWGCPSSRSQFSPVPLGLVFSLSPELSSNMSPKRDPPKLPLHPRPPPEVISLLPDVIICRKSKYHVSEHKILSFIYAPVHRKEKKITALFSFKKKKLDNVQALVTLNQPVISSQKTPDPKVSTAIINCENYKNGNKN